MLCENQVQKLLQSEMVFCHSNALAVTVTWHFTLYSCQNCILNLLSYRTQTQKILVVIPAQTGQEHIGQIQGGSIHVLSCVRTRKDRVFERQTASIHQDRNQ